jgi:hypothetical protein
VPAESSHTTKLKHLAINLFHGWGYNFYRRENTLRADDLMVRAKVSELLAASRVSVHAAERAYRLENLPPPSREKPRPDPTALRDAQTLERLGGAIGRLEGHVRALPVPEADRMTDRLRQEAATLARLLEADAALVGHAEFLRSVLQGADSAWLLGHAEMLAEQIGSLEAALQSRRDVLAF